MLASKCGILRRVLALSVPVLLDADALNILAASPALRKLAAGRAGATILTPHPGEAGRLLGCDAAAVNADRVAAAKKLAAEFGATAVLKGAGTVVCSPAGKWAICAAGNAGLARGGSGDVLSGIIAALLAQTQDADYAARAGVFLHAAAADALAKNGCAASGGGELGLDVNALPRAAAGIARG